MPSRRVFLRNAAAAGIAFVGCGLCRQSTAQSRQRVRIGNHDVQVVDVHAHCAIPEAMSLMGMKVTPDALLISDDRARTMDQQRIDVAALSINPYWYAADRELADKIVRVQNEGMAELCARSKRFVAFATVALQFPDLAIQQLEEAVKKLALKGASIGGSVNGEELSNPKFHPFWEKAQQLDVPVFLHPQGVTPLAPRLKGNGFLENTIGNPLETTIALSHLIFEGTLDRFPKLKICAAHGGGYLPFYADRSDQVCITFPERCKDVVLKKKPTEYLKQLYFDSIVFTPQALAQLVARVGANQVVMGTDSPYPWSLNPVDHILQTPHLTDEERAAILGKTAANLLNIK